MQQHRPMTEAEVRRLDTCDDELERLVADWRSFREALAALGCGWSVDRMVDGSWLWCGPDGTIHTLPDTGPVPSLTEALLEAFRRR